MADDQDEPMTPAGRMFLQPQIEQIINCAISLQNPPDIDAIKAEAQDSIMLKHPRFCSLMVKDPTTGREHWRRTKVHLDRHIIVRHDLLSPDDPDVDAVNDYVADLSVSSPLATDKPLWELHVLVAHKTLVFRVHHALGDGISLMSLLMSCCRRVDDPKQVPTIGGVGASRTRTTRGWMSFWNVLKVVWYTLVYVSEFGLRSMWKKDRETALSGGAGVEMWPRRLATARFRIDDMKSVKSAVADATINDVLFGVISCGLSRYLDIRSSEGKNSALPEGFQITGLAMVNLRPQLGLQDITKLMDSKSGTRWGNKFGMLLLPVYYHRDVSDPIQFVKRAKSMIDKKKLSLEAPLSYKIGDMVMSLFGAKFATILNYRILCNTTFTVSNIVGPQEEITIAGNPVTSIRASSSSLPHAITMHMVSYAGRAEMQILVAKELIPDPQVLATCFEDALLKLKEAAETAAKS